MTLLQRSIQALFKLNVERPPMSLGTGTGLNLAGVISGEGTSNQLSQMQAMTQTSWLFAVVDRIAASTAAVPWALYRRMPNNDVAIVPKHPLVDLWQSVNPFYTRHEFIETSVQHFELTGEIWWLIVRNAGGMPLELWPIRPDRIRPVPHVSEFIAGYIYSIGSMQIPLQREDVIFIRRPSPIDPYRGIGTVQSLFLDLGAEHMAAQWTKNFFGNGAMPGGILQFDEGMSDAEFERLVSRWSQQHQGVANAHRVAVLERGKWVDRKFSQRDMQMAELRKLNRDTILGAFGIPASVMGVTESVNRANAEAGDVMFGRWILTPLLERIKQSVNERLVSRVDNSLFLDFEDPTPENRELHLRMADTGFKAGFLTRNESRALLGYGEALEGGDAFMAPAPPPPASLAIEDMVRKAANELHDDKVNDVENSMESKWAKRLGQERDALVTYLEEIG
jgi:HK97 family phage portal protein